MAYCIQNMDNINLIRQCILNANQNDRLSLANSDTDTDDDTCDSLFDYCINISDDLSFDEMSHTSDSSDCDSSASCPSLCDVDSETVSTDDDISDTGTIRSQSSIKSIVSIYIIYEWGSSTKKIFAVKRYNDCKL